MACSTSHQHHHYLASHLARECKRRRQILGLDQSQLAERLGVGLKRDKVTRLESLKRPQWTLADLPAVAIALECTIQDLLEGLEVRSFVPKKAQKTQVVLDFVRDGSLQALDSQANG